MQCKLDVLVVVPAECRLLLWVATHAVESICDDEGPEPSAVHSAKRVMREDVGLVCVGGKEIRFSVSRLNFEWSGITPGKYPSAVRHVRETTRKYNACAGGQLLMRK